MRLIRSSISAVAAVLLALPATAAAERAQPSAGDVREAALSLDTIIARHVAALGGAKLLRAGKSLTFTVSGEKDGKQFTKTVVQVRPNKLRVDFTSDAGPMSKGYDGKVAWIKKGTAAPEAMSAEDTAAMAMHATFEEPLLDYAKKGTAVKLVGSSEVAGAAAYDLEVKLANGEVEHHFLDATTFLLAQKTFAAKDKDGKTVQKSVQFGDYKKVQGRMINHSVRWVSTDGKSYATTISKIRWDRAYPAKLFAMPKR